ncbi:MAG TPA: XisI protein [Cyanobacteria bacterium UBA11149]|nr:XisI protein [Cyanobacteria bacterium UBA11367]HBE57045.1 XisI protein [Cyanobacteria bacterium UBA11366]HBK63374.1 XisI protein [Cyanobacteria bacterium UBA11166]HBR74340.1 XisI protein [Cyanobacteria bacterium UBA11159]HBS68692.1 XisI protein [Cyanobacteria bacterium UBA11153]HBW88915.1 XisI protein [Cyanobacteria bacterium UBA11149]HCA93290.1 XisI protein [Cyanobacteria bacterium UBA9226]
MDTTTKYREILKQLILEYAKLRPSHGQIRIDAVCDEIRDRYALMHVGWDGSRRVRGNLLYVVIQEGKILIEYDGIGYGISSDLIARGIPESDIIFAQELVSTAVA